MNHILSQEEENNKMSVAVENLLEDILAYNILGVFDYVTEEDEHRIAPLENPSAKKLMRGVAHLRRVIEIGLIERSADGTILVYSDDKRIKELWGTTALLDEMMFGKDRNKGYQYMKGIHTILKTIGVKVEWK